MNATTTQATTETIDTLVIGAGQAGLSAGHHLARMGLPFLILDADERIGDHWRDRWDSLRLYSPARYDSLPGMPFPRPAFHYPTGREMGDYLAGYARRFDLPVRSGVRVDGLARLPDGTGFIATAGERRFVARQVVVASGPFNRPYTPALAAELDPAIHQLHSHAYRNPDQLRPGPVLVVGLSHSGADIALEAAQAGHPTTVAGRLHGQLPVRVIDARKAYLAWPVIQFAFAHLLTIRTPIGRKMRPEVRTGGGPLLRVRMPDLAAAGVTWSDGRVEAVRDGRPLLGDGTIADVANVVWATGYRPDYSWIEAPVTGPDGWPVEERGVSPTIPGLYFLGIPFTYAFSSMLVAGAGRDARWVVDRIAERVAGDASRRAAQPATA